MQLVRETLPPVVLTTYDALQLNEPALQESPEVFAMAVLADAPTAVRRTRGAGGC